METHITNHRGGFPVGMTKVLALGDQRGVDIAFYIVRLEGNTSIDVPPVFHQCGAVLLVGSGTITVCPTRNQELPPVKVARKDVFTEPPHSFLLPRGAGMKLAAGEDGLELALFSVPGQGPKEPLEVKPGDVRSEERGEGLHDGTFHRVVRTVADGSNAKGWGLVFGEVVNKPGRWSSYPPHHHDQPEIYHYRFTAPQGYGHAELGDEVLKVRDGDTVIIPPGRDHAQVSAPGYGMYYLWMIRHLPGNPYTGFTFAPEHTWTLDPRQQGWMPPAPPVPHSPTP